MLTGFGRDGAVHPRITAEFVGCAADRVRARRLRKGPACARHAKERRPRVGHCRASAFGVPSHTRANRCGSPAPYSRPRRPCAPLSKTRPSRGTRRRRALGRGRRGVQVRRLLAPPHRSWNDPALRPCRRRRSPSGYRPAWQIASSAALPWTRARQLGGNGPAVLRVFAFFPGKFE